MDRAATIEFIHENFGGIIEDHPWEDSPEYTVFRHADNHKWFALIARVKYQTLGINHPGEVDFINLKADPDLIETLVANREVLPAYHMNKRHWLTIPLDRSHSTAQIQDLIALSYQLTAHKRRQH